MCSLPARSPKSSTPLLRELKSAQSIFTTRTIIKQDQQRRPNTFNVFNVSANPACRCTFGWKPFFSQAKCSPLFCFLAFLSDDDLLPLEHPTSSPPRINAVDIESRPARLHRPISRSSSRRMTMSKVWPNQISNPGCDAQWVRQCGSGDLSSRQCAANWLGPALLFTPTEGPTIVFLRPSVSSKQSHFSAPTFTNQR